MDRRSPNITVKSENGQFYIIRNLTPDVKPKLEPKSTAAVVQHYPKPPPIFTMANTSDESNRRLVYTPLLTVPTVPQLFR
jgi:hypothetical protein